MEAMPIGMAATMASHEALAARMSVQTPPAMGIAVDATLGPHFATHEGFVALFDNKIGKRAFNRLRPGGLVLLTPLRRQQQFDLWLAVMRSAPRFHQILGTRLLSVFERLPEP